MYRRTASLVVATALLGGCAGNENFGFRKSSNLLRADISGCDFRAPLGSHIKELYCARPATKQEKLKRLARGGNQSLACTGTVDICRRIIEETKPD